jgi:putative ABC transport system ATP-binding protein
MNDARPVARCEDLSKTYRTHTEFVEALVGCNTTLFPGQITVATGPSGSGKSTLLRIVAALDEPTSGDVWLLDRNVAGLSPRKRQKLRRDAVSYVFQRPGENFVPFLSVGDHLRMCGVHERAVQVQILDRLDLGSRIDQVPAALSGGEQQRAALAQAVATRRPIVVADEPTAELDRASAARVLDALELLAEEGAAVLIASHDENVLAIADSVTRLRDGHEVTVS